MAARYRILIYRFLCTYAALRIRQNEKQSCGYIETVDIPTKMFHALVVWLFEFRFQDRDAGEHLEVDIGRQLSQLREQSKTNRDNYGSEPDPFGRDPGLRRPFFGNDEEGGRIPEDREQERYRKMDDNHSPREWRRGRDGDMDRGFGSHVTDRNRDRNRDWGRDEERRRPREYGDRGEFSDGSEGSWEGGRDGSRERYRDRRRDRGRDAERYRGRRDRERDYRDRDDRDWRRDKWEERDDSRRRDYRDRRRTDVSFIYFKYLNRNSDLPTNLSWLQTVSLE